MTATAYDNYLESEVLSADPVKLITILYRAALDSIGVARRCLFDGDIAGRVQAVGKASAIVTELTCSLDRTNGGEIAQNLAELYDYIQRLLMDANFRQIDTPLAEAEELMMTLYEGWAACARKGAEQAESAETREALSALY